MWITFIALLLGGILGAAGMIVKNKPSAADAIAKLTPFQGYIGVVLLLWGIWDLIQSFSLLSLWGGIIGILALATAIVEIILGIVLGWSLIVKYSSGAAEKMESTYAKLVPLQGIFGILAILLGIFWLLFSFGIFNFMLF
ncbi:MAG: hypothetical protein GF399_04240 [Candidatus Coatesbacteria bacterium]|jgi:hypothetical protein|nr:hypothetical protein [Candidatus Coatesbacteria bacterium]